MKEFTQLHKLGNSFHINIILGEGAYSLVYKVIRNSDS